MAGSNNILQFDPNMNNMVDDTTYLNGSYRQNGVVSGIALANYHNKLFYQISSVCSALGQSLANKGLVISDANYNNLITALSNIALAGTEIGKSPSLIDIGSGVAGMPIVDGSKLTGIVNSGPGWIKFADGTMIQKVTTTLTANTAISGSYSYASAVINFPLSFIDTNYSSAFVHSGYIPVCFSELTLASYKTPAKTACVALALLYSTVGAFSASSDFAWDFTCTAIGRWKA